MYVFLTCLRSCVLQGKFHGTREGLIRIAIVVSNLDVPPFFLLIFLK